MRRLGVVLALAGLGLAVLAAVPEGADELTAGARAVDDRPPWARCETEEVAAAPTARPLPDVGGIVFAHVARLPGAVAATAGPDGRLWVATRQGTVVTLTEGASPHPVVDLTAEVSLVGEQGFLDLAFSPAGDRLYLSYTDLAGASRVDEVAVAPDGQVGPGRRSVLVVDQPSPIHNGGGLAVAADGSLLVSLGDGGYPMAGDWEVDGDGRGRAQDPTDLLGSLLRIDPSPHGGRPYGIPPGNPFADGQGGAPEVWAYGLRNPWRISLDPVTGDLWLGDVGHLCWEEVNHVPAAQGWGAGDNFGWNRYEGRHRFRGAALAEHVVPVHSYGRDEGCGVVGGHVYRGRALPALMGAYLFTDLCDSELRALAPSADGAWGVARLGSSVPGTVSFAVGGDGELYAVSLLSGVHRLEPASMLPVPATG